MDILRPGSGRPGTADGWARNPDRANSILHVIVGGRPAAPGRIRFRRDRFTDYLAAQPTTAGVFVVDAVDLQRLPVRTQPVKNPAKLYFGIWDYRKVLARGGPLQRKLLERVVQRVLQFEATTRVLWYTKPLYPSLAEALDWNAVVYDCSDFWTASRGHLNPIALWNAPRQARTEAQIIDACDLILVTSMILGDRIRDEFGRGCLLVENGVDFELFSGAAGNPPSEIADLPRPRLGFVGALKSHKIDFPLLGRVAETHLSGSLVLIGPDEAGTDRGGDFSRLCGIPNVHWLGPRATSDLPRYLSALDVGLLPYRNTEYNRAVFPIKFFEYLAAGLPVVGCGLPSTAAYSQEGVYKHVGNGAEEFAAACQAAVGWTHGRNQRWKVAAAADWNARFGLMLNAALESVAKQHAGIHH